MGNEGSRESAESASALAWKQHVDRDSAPSAFSPGETGSVEAESPVAVKAISLVGVSAWGGERRLQGYGFDWASVQAALVWFEAGEGESIALDRLLPPCDLVKNAPAPQMGLLKMFALRKPTILLGSYNLPDLPPFDWPGPMADLYDRRLLPDDVDLWGGLHFQGEVGLHLPAGVAEAAGDGSFLKKLFDASFALSGDIWYSEEDELLRVRLDWNRGGKETSFALRPGADWNLTVKRLGMDAVLTPRGGSLDRLLMGSELTLAGHIVDVAAEIDFSEGTIDLDVAPHWKIDLGWLKTLAGDKEYASGGGAFFDEKSGKEIIPAGAEFEVKRITGSVAWKPTLAATAVSVTIGSPVHQGAPQPWKLLGGLLVADITAFWSKRDGESSFDCALAGTWTWDGVAFSASLDTRSAEFFAKLDFRKPAGPVKEFTSKNLMPGMSVAVEVSTVFDPSTVKLTLEEERGKNAEEKTKALEKKVQRAQFIHDAKVKLSKPFAFVEFEVTGNYRERSIAVDLLTEGYLGFRLTGKSDQDPERVEVRIGQLECGGTYDRSGEKGASWSVYVSGSIGLLKGGEPQVLGEGADVKGKFGTAGTDLSLSIKEFNIGELIGMLIGDRPPEIFSKIILTDLEIAYRSTPEKPKEEAAKLGDGGAAPEPATKIEPKKDRDQDDFKSRFTLKCKSDITLFSSVKLKGLEIESTEGWEAKDSKLWGSTKIGFGDKVTVELKATFEEKQIKFEGSTKDVDLTALIDGFTGKKVPKTEGEPKPGNEPPKGGVVAEKISVVFKMPREKRGDEPAKAGTKRGNSIVITAVIGHGKSSVTFQLVALAMEGADGVMEWKTAFAGDLALKASSLPLVGDILGDKANEFSIDLNALYLSTDKTDAVEKLFGEGKFSEVWQVDGDEEDKDNPPKKKKKPKTNLKEGFSVSADFKTGKIAPSAPAPSLPAPGKTAVTAKAEAAPAPPLPGGDLTWKDTALRLGPVQLSRVGYGMVEKNGARAGKVRIDAALDLGVLRMAVIGLGLDVEVPSFQVTPRLEGLAINVRNGPVEISGALVYRNGVYMGTAQVKTPAMTLGAIGSFTIQNGRPSFFLYCVCERSLGGPPEFFIEGFAGGMGYDTRLILPEVQDVPKFALVKAAKDGLGKPEDAIASFSACVVLAPQNIWFAAGIRISSYKMVYSTIVLVLSIGDDIEIDLFGLSSLRVPMKLPGGKELKTIASVDLAIRGKLAPKKGELWIRGQIMPGSWVFDEKCQITGGFAFQVWFSGPHKGDFSISVGGYHPLFKRPAHFFDLPRFALEWQLTPELSVKGAAYMAITSRAIMAGGRLEILYRSGSVRASFVAEAHFLAAWAPLQYMADVSIAVDATFQLKVWRWTKDISVHVSAQLHLEGPPFSGFAKIDLGPITIRIDFGNKALPPAVPWEKFAEQFLPPAAEIISVRPTGISPPENVKPVVIAGDGKVVTRLILLPGREWELAIESSIPLYTLAVGGREISADKTTEKIQEAFAVAPAREWVVTSRLIVTSLGHTWDTLAADLVLDTEQYPAQTSAIAPALWSEWPDPNKPPANGDPRLNPPSPEDAPRALNGTTLRSRKTKPLTGVGVSSAGRTATVASLPAPLPQSSTRAVIRSHVFDDAELIYTRKPSATEGARR